MAPPGQSFSSPSAPILLAAQYAFSTPHSISAPGPQRTQPAAGPVHLSIPSVCTLLTYLVSPENFPFLIYTPQPLLKWLFICLLTFTSLTTFVVHSPPFTFPFTTPQPGPHLNHDFASTWLLPTLRPIPSPGKTPVKWPFFHPAMRLLKNTFNDLMTNPHYLTLIGSSGLAQWLFY